MRKTFIIADTHFGDPSIITSIGRDFESVKEMDSFMIEKWNSVVSKDAGHYKIMVGTDSQYVEECDLIVE